MRISKLLCKKTSWKTEKCRPMPLFLFLLIESNQINQLIKHCPSLASPMLCRLRCYLGMYIDKNKNKNRHRAAPLNPWGW